MAAKTYSQPQSDVSRSWYLLDASGVPLGRLATQVATLLSGKSKPTYTPHIDNGDYVVVINAGQIKLTGRKPAERKYHHTGYPGGIKSVTKGELLKTQPQHLVEEAVRGMLAKNKLLGERLKRLKVYADDQHEHQAQQPKQVEIEYGR